MSEGNSHLTACHECDLLLQAPVIAHVHGVATCPRCGAVLGRADNQSLEHTLALACAALVLLVIGNLYPLIGLNIQGQHVETTVIGAARQLWHEDMPAVSLLLLTTTTLIPLVELCVLIWLLLPLRLGWRPRGFVSLFKALQLVRPWAMVEVFILGVLVALVKLAHMADVLPGMAIWCFGLLMLLLTALSVTFNSHVLWETWEAAEA